MLFSILIPTGGNRPVLIAMAVRSVLRQTCQDFEVVVADVRGSAETKAAVFSSGDTRVRYFMVPQGRGPNYSFDYSALQARGRYILWLDDDNYLLPHALDLFKRVIDAGHPDIVTASHLYYYDEKHPRHHLRNHLGIVPFTGSVREVRPRDIIAALFSFARRGGVREMPRFHTSATTISMETVRRAQESIGTVVFEDLPSGHSQHPILLAFARACVFVDVPVMVVGRFGVSMSQVWSTAARARFKRDAFPLRESPLVGHSRISAVFESYLRVQKLLPELLGDIPINKDRLAELYLDELVYLDMDFSDFVPVWRNFFFFLGSLSRETAERLRRRAISAIPRALLVLLARRLGLHHRLRAFKGKRQLARAAELTPREKMQRGAEFEIPFEKYGVRTIEDLGVHAREILLAELGMEISTLGLSF